MNRYRSVFKRRNTFLVVIHVEDESQARRNIAIALENGADGVFLINHSISSEQLIAIFAKMRKEFPDFWMGMNMLDLNPYEALAVMGNMGCETGLWVDNAGIYESGPTSHAKGFVDYRSEWNGIYFGGVAFKYQEAVSDPGRVTKLAVPYVDVITTSGSGTGFAPDLEKIKAMKKAAVDHPLANASGITPENVREYQPYVDCFIVATGVSDSHTELNAKRVREFADITNGFK